nr:PREDICTED: alkaline phosphatase-like isoform X1 [Bemisia tabaci]XP_018915088.1 PREDICTED: alkaline phosphatase-like isoform X1 [Bemisia tabaci]
MGSEATLLLCLFLVADLDTATYAQPGNSRVGKVPLKPSHYLTENDNQYWLDSALAAMQQKLDTDPIRGTAKNVIMFLGDGMSVPTVTAARIYAGQLAKKKGESSSLAWERFPYLGLAKTYCVDKQVADSACTATAYLNGVKNNYATIGVNAKVKRKDCAGSKDAANRTASILKWAQDAGKATGVITTTRVTHASPAGTYAHTSERDWESDFDIANDTEVKGVDCHDIAKQLILDDPGRNIKVIMGGGRRKFLPNTVRDPEGQGLGQRLDNQNLIRMWEQDKSERGSKPQFVFNRKQLLDLNILETDYLLGLFEASHMRYHLEADPTTEPTLAEMTEAAVKLLKKEKNGFFLFVEGGLIDKAHHENWAQMALDEAHEMSKAVETAVRLTQESDTLIVVTADHAHTMSMSGYPARGNDILAATEKSDVDNKLYATLSYANGMGYREAVLVKDADGKDACTRFDLANDLPDRKKPRYRFPSMFPNIDETHGGDDVAVYARGPWAHLLTGSHEQHLIPVVMAYSAGIGPAASMPHASAAAHLRTSPAVVWGLILSLVLILYSSEFPLS